MSVDLFLRLSRAGSGRGLPVVVSRRWQQKVANGLQCHCPTCSCSIALVVLVNDLVVICTIQADMLVSTIREGAGCFRGVIPGITNFSGT